MKKKKVITGTMVARGVGVLGLVIIPISFIITFLRTDASLLEVIWADSFLLVSGLATSIILLVLTAKKEDEK